MPEDSEDVEIEIEKRLVEDEIEDATKRHASILAMGTPANARRHHPGAAASLEECIMRSSMIDIMSPKVQLLHRRTKDFSFRHSCSTSLKNSFQRQSSPPETMTSPAKTASYGHIEAAHVPSESFSRSRFSLQIEGTPKFLPIFFLQFFWAPTAMFDCF